MILKKFRISFISNSKFRCKAFMVAGFLILITPGISAGQEKIKCGMEFASEARMSVQETTVDGDFVLDPDKPQNFPAPDAIACKYLGKDYKLIPIDKKLNIRIIKVGNQRAGFASFFFQGSLILENTWSMKTSLGDSKWTERLAILDTKSKFKKMPLDPKVMLYTTEGIKDGKIEVLFFKRRMIPLIQNPMK